MAAFGAFRGWRMSFTYFLNWSILHTPVSVATPCHFLTDAFCFNWSDRIQRHLITEEEKVCQPMRLLTTASLLRALSKFSVHKCRKWICCTVCSAYICFEIIRICLFRQSSSTAPARLDTYTSQIIWFILTTNYPPLFVRRLYGGYFSPVTTCQ